jgi:hypothetical protein
MIYIYICCIISLVNVCVRLLQIGLEHGYILYFLGQMNENGQRRHSFRKHHHNHHNHHAHKRHGGGPANRNNNVTALVEGKKTASTAIPSDASSMSDDDEEEEKGKHAQHNRAAATLEAAKNESAHDASPQKGESAESSLSSSSSSMVDAEYSKQAADRARQRNKANALREALMMVPDKSRIKYLEQLLGESVARELQLEDQLTALLLRSRLQAKNGVHTSNPASDKIPADGELK